MRYGGPIGKIARRLGVAITPKCVALLERRPNPPGQHGKNRRRSQSNYQKQLLEKQKLRFQFMLTEKVLRRYYAQALRDKGSTAAVLLNLLEQRLDATLVRGGIAPTMLAARQLINHRHVLVNGKRVTYPSYVIKPTDVVSLTEKAKQMPIVLETLKNSNPSPYMELNKDSVTVKRVRDPERHEIPVICEEQVVVEWYSQYRIS